jgi:hypothetical protein
MSGKRARPARGRMSWVATAASILMAGSAVLAAGAALKFNVRLQPVPIDAATSATVTGSGSATAVLDGVSLKLEGSFAGLHSPARGAHLNVGPVTGVAGPSVHGFSVPAAVSGTFSAEWRLTREQADAVRRGRAYLQIDSEGAPEGNLWGWLLP